MNEFWSKGYDELNGSGVKDRCEIAKTRTGFMCKIDFDHELGMASGGNRVHPSVEDLIREHTCAEDCGIVEVEIKLVRVVKEGEH